MKETEVKTRFFLFDIIKNKEIDDAGVEVSGISNEFKEYKNKSFGNETLYFTELKGTEYQIICEGIYDENGEPKARKVVAEHLPLILS